MKKFLVLLTMLAVFASCSDDDDVNGGEEQIVGSWMLVDWSIPGYGEPTDCNLQSNITFNSDNTADSEFYEEVEGECMADSQSGDWEAHGDGEYTFDVPSLGEQTGTVEFQGDNSFTFSLTGISMTFERE